MRRRACTAAARSKYPQSPGDPWQRGGTPGGTKSPAALLDPVRMGGWMMVNFPFIPFDV